MNESWGENKKEKEQNYYQPTYNHDYYKLLLHVGYEYA